MLFHVSTMRRVCQISELQKYINGHYIITKPSFSAQFSRQHVTQTHRVSANHTTPPDFTYLFSDNWSPNPQDTISKQKLRDEISQLKDELLVQSEDVEKIEKVLELNGVALFRKYSDRSPMVELMTQLSSFPSLAMEVFSWRRKQLDYASPMNTEEYTKGITMASRLKNIDLAVELFNEASNKRLTNTSLYNALMSAYMYNGLTMKCQSLFRDLKKESACTPSITTYNILISAFGRLMLVDHMEATLKEIKDLNIPPTIDTYKGLIGGYVTAWKWEEMEKTYWLMKAGPIKPDVDIHLLMLRGYAHSGKLGKMEEIYEKVKGHVDYKQIPLIRTMISAYCRSSDVARVQKVEDLLRLIPENEYRPWLNVTLICLYANEDLLEKMENSIKVAFENNAYITTVGVMRCIISSYFRQNMVDKLAEFVQCAECAGWKLCRSLYHCKMVLYANEMRISEMERVLDEMDRLNIPFSKNTFWILYKTYQTAGNRFKVDLVAGMMFKRGYGIPMNINSYECLI
ncbi:hypothetical protein CASFOL_029591 [Castilleja foliolosa]|uniref:Pentatricopeptide repeat-containing protein n=1 Tax=Castilleja foliolosa TaxID=1961234 RepID=A0ABD3CBF5_9LAMI